MRRYLLAAVWPAGMAAIAAATVIAARRAPAASSRRGASSPAWRPGADPDPARQAEASGEAGREAVRLAEVSAAAPPAGGRLGELPEWVPGLIKLGAISGAGGALSYAVMTVLGPPVVNVGPAIDEPIMRWVQSHQIREWAAIMARLNKVGGTWTNWGSAGTAAACLAVTWRAQKWLPPAVLGAAILVDHYTTLALRHTFRRPGPPNSPLGTYPSGGCDRVVLFYGLIAHMLWREFSGSHRGKVWAIGAVSALSFNVAYCRAYLSKHWFTDIVFGLVYGAALLMPLIAAIRLIAGPPAVTAAPGRPELVAVMAA
ncbi:MAG TPA: phosphatase PAP2 family protein [Streptosporangiaceae bacterium]|nr:phosphatase PAP2 family protein [Streptosporangiaceae bacterium]